MAPLAIDLPDLQDVPVRILTWGALFSALVFALDAWALWRALSRGHGVHGTLAWVFGILAFPLVGALAFFALASPSVKRVRLRRRGASARLSQWLAARAGESAPAPDTGADSMIDLAAAVTGLEPTAGNWVDPLTDDTETFARIEAALRDARRSIWAEYYIISNDETGRRFLELLAEKAAAGVEVRLLHDALGSMHLDSKRLLALLKAGGHAHAFLPMNPLRRRFAVHLRNHRKLIVVDGEIGFTGGMNMGDEYSGRRRRKGMRSFRDTHLEIRGPAMGSLAHVFAEDWSFATGETLPLPRRPVPLKDGRSIVAVVPSGPDQEHNASAMVHFAAIASARKRAYLTSPYFIPDDPTVSALVSAALRRVDVRLLVPRASDVPLVRHAAWWYFGKLLRGGVRIYEYEPAMLHAKTLAVDGTLAMVGSANVDLRSYRLNFELGCLVADAEFAGALEKRYFRDLAHSHPITLEDLHARSRWEVARCAVARLLSPMM